MIDLGFSLTIDHGFSLTKDVSYFCPFLIGIENGLQLTLNIEQYEYMPGPHDAAGVKMLIHDHKDIPMVHALGQAISPGSRVFVGMKIIEVGHKNYCL